MLLFRRYLTSPWDASVKSLVAFPQLMALMGENPQWVQNLGDAFLAQPQEVMDSVQRLRQLAQQTGSLKSSTKQKVITTTKKAVPVKTDSHGSRHTIQYRFNCQPCHYRACNNRHFH